MKSMDMDRSVWWYVRWTSYIIPFVYSVLLENFIVEKKNFSLCFDRNGCCLGVLELLRNNITANSCESIGFPCSRLFSWE